ncbi:MAG TPA: DUF4347 domain-containing protein, partial [Azospirillaceae bacterium]|nr:DUF4347 domain-containing protein [Azospirillaceae bacterium]
MPSRAMVLEPRFMFDAAGAVTVAEVVADSGIAHGDGPAAPDDVLMDALAQSPAAQESAPAAPEPSVPAAPPAPVEIAFVDTSVPGSAGLIQGLRPGVEVVSLDPSRDGLEQIGEALRGRDSVSAIHILSHSDQGRLVLGAASLDAAALEARADALAEIGRSLAEGGDILIHGCDLARGAEGQIFVGRLAELTGADVAASDDATGAATMGGDWDLEVRRGTVETATALTAEGQAAFTGLLNSPLDGATGWTPVLLAEPTNDTQAKAADTDLIGSATRAVLYTSYSDNGTANNAADDLLSFRIRIDNPTSSTYFGGVAVVGIDANNDGKVDVFLGVDGRNNGQVIRILDPGTGLNISPSTTSTSALPVGWLANNGVYGFTASNYKATAVSSTSDPQWDGDADLGNDGDADLFVSFRVPMADLATVLSKASPVNRTGVVGPRGTTGIAGFNKDTTVRYVVLTQTQPGPLNGDLGGVGSGYNASQTYAQLGATTGAMTPGGPIAAGKGVAVTTVSGDGNLSATEDDSVTISGTATAEVAAGDWVKVTVLDGSSGTVESFVQVGGGKTWSASGLDLSSLADGSLTVKAELWTNGTSGGSRVTGSSTGSSSLLHDKTPPVLTVDTLATTAGTPTLTGTADLPVGTLVTITVEPDNDSGTSDTLTYQTAVRSGGTWSVDTATARPATGSFPTGGLTGTARVTASGSDTAGNQGSGTGLNRPTVTPVTTTSARPTISGTWTKVTGDVLTVTVGGTTYAEGTGLTVGTNSWSLVPGADLSVGTHEVVAKVARGGTEVTDTTANEVTYATGPSITISGGDAVGSTVLRPTITGTSSVTSGTVVVRLDPGNDGMLGDAVTYSVATNGSGAWTLDTSSLSPISGSVPTNGFNGAVGVLATATTGSGTATDTQVLTVTQPTVAVSSIVTTASAGTSAAVLQTGDSVLNAAEDLSVKVTGTSTADLNATVNVVVSDASGNRVTGTATVGADGKWEATGLNLSTLDNGTLTATATLAGTAISGSGTVTHDKSPPRIFITSNSVINRNNGVISGTSELTSGSVTITITKAGTDVDDASGTATISGAGAWSYTTNLNNSVKDNDALVVTVSSTATDSSGNYALAAKDDFVAQNGNKGGSGAVTINTIAGNDQIVTDEMKGGLTISGTVTSGLTSVVLEITDSRGSSSTYQTGAITVTGTTWTTTIPEATVRGFINGDLTVVATATNASNEVKNVAKPQLALAPPALTISDTVTGAADGPVTFTFDFTEEVSGFTAADVTVTGGTAGSLSGSGKTYTMTVTPTASSAGTITVDVAAAAGAGTVSGRNSLAAATTQVYDTVAGNVAAPSVTVDADGLATSARPTITGTTSLPAGASIVVVIDPDNDAGTSNSVTYSATVGSGGAWSVNTATAVPTSGSVPSSGFAAYALVTATGTNAYGASTTATALNKPTVTPLLTTDDTPLVTGTWTSHGSDTLSVVINGVTYTSGSGLTVGTNSWSVQAPQLADGTYSVTATATRGLDSKVDATSNELVVDDTAPAIAITSPTLRSTAKPTITGTTDLPAGAVLTITLDPDNDAGTANDITYVTLVGTGGAWSLDTATALPSSGTLPDAGLSGPVGVKAQGTDAAGNSATATQTLTVDVTPPVIGFTTNRTTREVRPFITGTTDLPSGTVLAIKVGGQNLTATVQADGTWSVQSGADLSGTVALEATGTDTAGNSVTTTTTITIDASSPALAITESFGDADANGKITGTENGAVTIGGTVQDIANASVISTSITDGTTTILDNATVTGGAWSIDPLNIKGLKNGTITVSATYVTDGGDMVRDTATFVHEQTSPPADVTSPVIDLAPSDDNTASRTYSASTAGLSGTAISLDDNSAAATVTDASDALTQVRLTVGGLVDGASEKLLFGTSAVSADGTGFATLTNIAVGGVQVTVTRAGSTFTIVRADAQNLTVAEAQAVIRAIEYRNDAATVGGGSRTFTFATTDATGNNSINATATLALTAPTLNVAPSLTATAANPTHTEGGAAAAPFTGTAIGNIEAGQSVSSLTFTVSGVLSGDRLGLDGSSLAIAADATGTTSGGRSYAIAVASGTATVTVTGTLTAAQAQSLVNGITLSSTGTAPSG